MPVKVSISWQSADGFAGLGETILPGRFTARFEQDEAALVELEIAVIGGRPSVEAIRLERNPDGPPLTGEEIRRVPLANWMDYACAQAGMVRRGEGVYAPPATNEEEQLVLEEAQEARRRRVITDQFLRSVMSEWGRAEALGYTGRDVADHVADHFKKSTSQIYRWRQEAQRRGFVGPELP